MSSDSSDAVDDHGRGPDTGSDTGGYVHRPGDVDSVDSSVETAVDASSGDEPYTGEPEGEGFGAQGWLLVAGVVVCFLVIPSLIYLFPAAPAQLGWTFFATFLALPLVPAVLLGLLAVWSMQAAA